jgi:glycerol-3-phosphate dehydrogenase
MPVLPSVTAPSTCNVRVVGGNTTFVIPFEGELTSIGATGVEHHGANAAVRIDDCEIACRRKQASRHGDCAVVPADEACSCSSVRPLLDLAGDNITTCGKLTAEAAWS